jgi:hypothetical protein
VDQAAHDHLFNVAAIVVMAALGHGERLRDEIEVVKGEPSFVADQWAAIFASLR